MTVGPPYDQPVVDEEYAKLLAANASVLNAYVMHTASLATANYERATSLMPLVWRPWRWLELLRRRDLVRKVHRQVALRDATAKRAVDLIASRRLRLVRNGDAK